MLGGSVVLGPGELTRPVDQDERVTRLVRDGQPSSQQGYGEEGGWVGYLTGLTAADPKGN
jgi:hypothetical protein